MARGIIVSVHGLSEFLKANNKLEIVMNVTPTLHCVQPTITHGQHHGVDQWLSHGKCHKSAVKCIMISSDWLYKP